MKIGRNDTCPCSSGLKYKKCCANKIEIVRDKTVTDPVMADIKQLLQSNTFNTHISSTYTSTTI